MAENDHRPTVVANPAKPASVDHTAVVLRPEPVDDPGATFSIVLSPAHALEVRAIAERAGATVSAVFEASWHLGKQAVYDRLKAKADRLGLDLTMLVDDTSPPAPLEPPAFAHEPLDVAELDLTTYQETSIKHGLALSERALTELAHMATMFDVPRYDLLDEAYLRARARLV